MRLRHLLALLLAFGLLAAACSDDDDSADVGSDADSADDGDADDSDEDTADDDMVDEGADCTTKTEGVLTVATGEPVFLPWMSDDDPTNEMGFEAALVYALAAELGIDTVEWTRTGFDEAVTEENHQIAVIGEDFDAAADDVDGGVDLMAVPVEIA